MRKKLIKAAVKQYALHGYQGATMKKVADEVGIKAASIYFFYKNKEELFIAAFQQLLDDHFWKMERIVEETKGKPIEEVLTAMFAGIAAHHKGDMQATNAYISLVTSPISEEVSKDLHHHMARYNAWLVESLESMLQESYPGITADEMDRVIKQFVLIGNGIFWGIKLYDQQDFDEQLWLANHIMHALLEDLNKVYKG